MAEFPQKLLSCTTRLLLLVAFVFLVGIGISACVTFFPKSKVSCGNYTRLLQVRDSNFEVLLQNATNSTVDRSKNLKDKLKRIRELSLVATRKYEGHGRGDSCDFTAQTEICYTEECLDAALTLLKSINFSVDPCSNFYQFSCGGWIQDNPIPPTMVSWNIYYKLQQNVTNISREILESPIKALDSKPVQQAKQFYVQCLDQATREKAGLAPLLEMLEPYGGWPVVSPHWNPLKFDVNVAIASGYRIFQKGIILRTSLVTNLVNNSEYLLHLGVPEFFLPEKILQNQAKYPSIIKAYQVYFTEVAKEFGKVTGVSLTDQELHSQFKDILDFETRLANANESLTVALIRSSYLPQNVYTDTNNKSYTTSEFNLKKFLEQLFLTSGVQKPLDPETDANLLSISQKYLSEVIAILRSTDVRTVANYFSWKLVSIFSILTTERMRGLRLDFDKVKTGIAKLDSIKDDCTSASASIFDSAIGSKFIDKILNNNSKEVKASVTEMVGYIREAFTDFLTDMSWMDTITKDGAVKKLKAMKTFVGYPDWISDQHLFELTYKDLQLVPGDFFRSAIALTKWSANGSLTSLRRRPNSNQWSSNPETVNAFYAPTQNSLTIPAAILQPPFFTDHSVEYLNYGGIGTSIGHEMAHGFDWAGIDYDSKGNYKSWYTSQSLVAYGQKLRCLITQYSNFTPIDGVPALSTSSNGYLTLNENIGDNVGVRQAFSAYQKWIDLSNGGKSEPRLPGLEMFSPQQLFFVEYATKRCESTTAKGVEYLSILQEPHSSGPARVQIPLQNFEKFALNWRCPIGSPMNPPAEEKCD